MMLIRRANANDIPVLAGFQKKMAVETENVVLEETILLAGLNQFFADEKKGIYYVAEIDGKIAGCLMTTFEWSEWRNGSVLWIQSVYVPAEFRGMGVYKTMYTHIQERVKDDTTLRGIRLYVDKTNVSAQKIYSKLGMDGDHYIVYEWMK